MFQLELTLDSYFVLVVGERPPPTSVACVRFQPAVICGLSLLLVPCLARRGFLWFSPSTKSNTPNPNSSRIVDPRENQLRLIGFLSNYY